MILDAIATRTMMELDVEKATKIIDVLASTEYQVQHRQPGQKK